MFKNRRLEGSPINKFVQLKSSQVFDDWSPTKPTLLHPFFSHFSYPERRSESAGTRRRPTTTETSTPWFGWSCGTTGCGRSGSGTVAGSSRAAAGRADGGCVATRARTPPSADPARRTSSPTARARSRWATSPSARPATRRATPGTLGR